MSSKYLKRPVLTVCYLVLLISCSAKSSAGEKNSAKEGPKDTSSPSRGVLVFKGTRIPTIVMTGKGTLLAFCSPNDNHPGNFCVRRSEDNGRTWGKLIRISPDGRKLRTKFGEPGVVVDRKTGKIWAFFTRGTGRHKSPKTAMHFTYSKDDGRTWKTPISACEDPARFGKDQEFTPVIAWQGRGIQLSSGRLLVPCMRIDRQERDTACLYSDDAGKTWRVSNRVPGKVGQEICIVELTDGTVYMNGRRASGGRGPVVRWVSRSKDGGKTWSPPKGEKQLTGAPCHAGVIRLTDARRHDRNRLLFSLPEGTPQRRQNLRIWLSYDEGRTWKREDSRLLIPGSAAYSDMVLLPDMSIGILYETNKPKWHSIYFTRFTLEWLTGGRDKIAPSRPGKTTR